MRKFRRTSLIAALCLSALVGLGLSRKISFTPNIWYLGLSPVLLLLKRKSLLSLLVIVGLGLGLGLWRGSLYMNHVYQLKALTGQKVTIQATATADAVYSTRGQIEFTANKSQLLLPDNKPLAGSFKISGFGVPMIYRGDKVQVSGKLFPMRGSNQARIAYAQLQRLRGNDGLLFGLTRRFNAGMQSALPEPMASFGLGLLIGQRTTLPADITAALTAVGLVHIVAVSGYNLTIIVRGVGRLKLGSKYQKLLISLGLIAIFVLVTGFSASIVRAAIVSVLSLWAWYYGRHIKPVALISFAAAVTGLWNPFYIWGDLGWYLSFLAFFGVLVIAPLIAARFKQQPKLLTMVLLETLSAEVMTLPLILMTFSQLSIVALIANLLIVPLVPLAMLLTAVAGAAGAFMPQIAGWLALPARLLLTYMLDLVHALSNIPSALVHRAISLIYMLAFYTVVLLVVLIMHHRRSKARPKGPIMNTLNMVK
ncbi:ComEC/Rec2 family competence protein [Candidatus Saccharibacteria bacterium]|nr:ComEC/Rec2 family competence protein [Candidatus Saccharibacteria bacterium]